MVTDGFSEGQLIPTRCCFGDQPNG